MLLAFVVKLRRNAAHEEAIAAVDPAQKKVAVASANPANRTAPASKPGGALMTSLGVKAFKGFVPEPFNHGCNY